jgi:DNA-binding transcriptional ArsR family regulator
MGATRDESEGPQSPFTDQPAPPPGGWGPDFGLADHILLTPRRLRGLTHPIRVRLLFLLGDEGPATASQLGRRIGQSSGVTSYHLRMLAELGLVEDDPDRGDGRDRWWRVTRPVAGFTFRSPDDPADPETIEFAEQYLRVSVELHHERMLRYVESLVGRLEELPTAPWTMDDGAIEVTPEEARKLAADVRELLRPYRRRPGAAPRAGGALRAFFQFQMLPDDEEGGDDHQ